MICQGCGEKGLAYYINDMSGKRITINRAKPVLGGNLVLVNDHTYHSLTDAEIAELEGHQSLFTGPAWEGHMRYVAHLAICPHPAVADPKRNLKAHRR